MKINDLKLIGIIVLVALICFGIFRFTNKAGANVIVTVDGKEYASYSLDKEGTFEIKSEYGTNELVIKDHKAKVEDASCPDQLCVHQHAIDKTGQTIVCLPNKTVISIENGQESEADITAQ